jgi:hypothetical protein
MRYLPLIEHKLRLQSAVPEWGERLLFVLITGMSACMTGGFD